MCIVPSHSDIRGEEQKHSQKHFSNLHKGRTLPWKMGRKVFPLLSDEEKCCGSRKAIEPIIGVHRDDLINSLCVA